MKITCKIAEIQYGDIVIQFLPALSDGLAQSGNAIAKIVSTLVQLPEDVLRPVFDVIPEEDKNEIVSMLVEENQEKLLAAANDLLKGQGIRATVEQISLSHDLTLVVSIVEIDYCDLVTKYVPLLNNSGVIHENPTAAMLTNLLRLPAFLIKKTLDAMSQKKKDEIVAYLINRYKEQLLQKLTSLIAAHNIGIKLEEISVAND